MKKFYLTPGEADEYVRLRLSIEQYKADHDAYMKSTAFDYRFLKSCGVDWFETETEPSMPANLQPISQTTCEEEIFSE